MLDWTAKKNKEVFVWVPEDKYPHIKGYENLNYSKCQHKRRIARIMLEGKYMTSQGYADSFNHTDFRKRVSELRNDYGFDIRDVWATSESNKRYKEYYIVKGYYNGK